ncbi:MAG: hypothetical protein ACRD1I_07240 [Terriglobia bacterium]
MIRSLYGRGRPQLDLKRAAEHVDTLFARIASENVDREFFFAVQKFHIDLHMKIAMYARSEALRAAIGKNHLLVFNGLYDAASGPHVLPLAFYQRLIESIIDLIEDVVERYPGILIARLASYV